MKRATRGLSDDGRTTTTQSFRWGSSGNNGGRWSFNHPLLNRRITRQATTTDHSVTKSIVFENRRLIRQIINISIVHYYFCFCVNHYACIRVWKAHYSVQQASIHSQKKRTYAKIGKKSQV